MQPDAPAVPIVVMGVSGSGKTVTGSRLAVALGRPFVDADDLHPPANKEKMARGIPLNDEDRWGWLDTVGERLAGGEPVVVACSALKRVYRDRLRAAAPDAVFVHLHGSRGLLAERMGHRVHEFMPVTLLDSQLATLEPLQEDERGVVVDVAPPLPEVVENAVTELKKDRHD
ncbi:gluconokinase [Lysobacter korlensis]|uniref:Gluconokinase n=1 Tax=Lysobacter korlensis TaxID=553636 RepID=A0ABV6RYR7_9GAMM